MYMYSHHYVKKIAPANVWKVRNTRIFVRKASIVVSGKFSARCSSFLTSLWQKAHCIALAMHMHTMQSSMILSFQAGTDLRRNPIIA
jgi:hypothetical protein